MKCHALGNYNKINITIDKLVNSSPYKSRLALAAIKSKYCKIKVLAHGGTFYNSTHELQLIRIKDNR